MLWASPAVAHANFPPIAKASADPTEALVGEVVQFSSAETLDPDNGPSPLSYQWDFGDGTQSIEADPQHAFDTLGLHIVTLVVSDGQAQALVAVDVVVLEPATPVSPTATSMLALSADDARLWVANPDSDSVSVVEVGTDDAILEIPVGDHPRTVALSPAGDALYVACEEDDTLHVVDTALDEVVEVIELGHRPFGVAVVPTDGRLVVTQAGDRSVTVLDPQSFAVEATLELGGTPRAIAITADGMRAFVSHFLTTGDAGQVSVIDLDALAVLDPVPLVEDLSPDTSSSGGGFPNLLGALAIEPAGRAVWVGGRKANTGRGAYVSGELLEPRNRLRGLMARVDVLSALEEVERRIDTNDADSVSAIAFSPLGRFAYLTHEGAGKVSVYDLPEAALTNTADGSTVPFESRIDVGDAPQGIVLSSDGSWGYVANFMSRSVTVLDLTVPFSPEVARTITVTGEALPDVVANGKRLFYRSREPVHSDQNYIACASCHPDGGHDGRTWDFTQYGEGLRNTIDLRGRGGTDHGPVHWSANFDEIQDFENDIVGGFGGEGLAQDGAPPHPPLDTLPNAGRSQDLDDLAAFVASLKTPVRSPYRASDGGLTPAAQRGYDIFFDAEVGCADCHVPPRFTDSVLTEDPADFVLWDVGTLAESSGQRLGGPLVGLDTPSLLGVWNTAPYLHDGSAATLLEVLTSRNEADAHGKTSHLSAEELDDLVAFLLSLQGSPDEHPDLGGETTGADDGSGSSSDGVEDSTGPSDATAGSPGTDGGETDDPSASADEGGCGCTTARPKRSIPAVLLILLTLFPVRKEWS